MKNLAAVFLLFSSVALGTTITSIPSTSTALPVSNSSYCAGVASSCPFAQTGKKLIKYYHASLILKFPACVSYWCQYSCSDQSNCCKQANPQSCLVAANLQDPCFNIENSVILCTATADAECLCYDSAGNYNPSSFDNMVQSCSQLAAASSPSFLSFLTGSDEDLGYCTRFAGPNVNPASTSASPNVTRTASPTPVQTGSSAGTASTVSQAEYA
jgi:hypothetical protein